MDRISPIYHPSDAKNYLQLSNNLAEDGSYIWYDSDNPDNIAYPSDFRLNKTSNYDDNLNLKLSSIVLNNKSTMNTTMSLPAATGSFNATLVKQDTNSPPTIDLYFQGDIQVIIDCDSDAGWVYGAVDCTLLPNTFPTSSNISGTYSLQDQHIPSGYVYMGDRVTITNSWSTSEIIQKYDRNGSFNFNTHPSNNETNIPTVYINAWCILEESGPTPQPVTKIYKVVGVGPIPEPGSGQISGLVMRNEPTKTSGWAGSLKDGDLVYYYGESSYNQQENIIWYKVTVKEGYSPAGTVGWVDSGALEYQSDEGDTPTTYVGEITNTCDVYDDFNFTVTGIAYGGTKLTYIGEEFSYNGRTYVSTSEGLVESRNVRRY